MTPDRPSVKICGITSGDALDAAVAAGAQFVGFVFHPASPRCVSLEQAHTLSNKTPSNLMNVGLFVDPRPADIQKALEAADLDMIQLHGDESLRDIQIIRGQFGLPVMKAIRVGSKEDLDPVHSYEKICDWLLFDAKSDSAQGGAGKSFDWSLLKDLRLIKPWVLAGGLTAANVAQALSILKPKAVDVSSGVEDSPGVKNPQKIKDFIEKVKAADGQG